MAILTTAAKATVVNAFVGLIDNGTTDANGDLVIRNSANAELAVLAFSNPAFPTTATDTATASAIASDNSATAGTADDFIVRDRDNTQIFEGTVGTTPGASELVLSSLTFGAGDTIAVNSMTVAYP